MIRIIEVLLFVSLVLIISKSVNGTPEEEATYVDSMAGNISSILPKKYSSLSVLKRVKRGRQPRPYQHEKNINRQKPKPTIPAAGHHYNIQPEHHKTQKIKVPFLIFRPIQY